MSRTGLWDSHAHLDDEAFNEDREQLIAQLEQDMDGIVNPGCDAASSAVAVELAKKYPFIYAAVGWHPENLKGMNKEWDPVHWYEARKYIFNLLDKYNIKYVCAYNARFDYKALNNTMKYITHGKYKYYFHYNQVVWLDTMKAVNQVIATQKKYGKYCVNKVIV